MSWKNNRPENWDNPYKLVRIKYEDQLEALAYEAGADAIYEAMMKERPSNEEIRLQIISCLYGGLSVPELMKWLKEKLLIKEDG